MRSWRYKQAESIFEAMLEPLLNIVDKTESLEELQKILKDEKRLKQLYSDMTSAELEDLLRQGLYLAGLIGESQEE